MKKVLLGIATVIVLVSGLYFADQQQWLMRSGTKADGANAGEGEYTPAPEVELVDLDGKTVRLADYRGKVVLVNFWATWCTPCLTEIPWLIEFQRKYGEQGFVVLGLAVDDEGKSVVQPWVAEQKFEVDGEQLAVNYAIVLGSAEVEQKFGGIIGMPTSFLISRDGKIIKRMIGLVNHDYLKKSIEEQL